MTIRAAKFQGLGVITLQPADEDVSYTFEFEVASSGIANDGAIPYNQTLAGTPDGATVTIAKHPEETDYTTEIIGATVNTDTVVTVPMSYPYVTQMRVAAAGGITTMEVDSTTGMQAGDRVGIKLDDDSIHWTTIALITDADTFELTAGIPVAGNAAIDNNVYVPRMVRGIYHLRFVCHFSPSGTDKEFDFNRVYVRDV
jgi:hypothetical protein